MKTAITFDEFNSQNTDEDRWGLDLPSSFDLDYPSPDDLRPIQNESAEMAITCDICMKQFQLRTPVRRIETLIVCKDCFDINQES